MKKITDSISYYIINDALYAVKDGKAFYNSGLLKRKREDIVIVIDTSKF